MKRCNYWFLAIGTLLILALTACDVNIGLGGYYLPQRLTELSM